MANEEQLSILKQGVEVWNKWRTEKLVFPGTDLELSGADLSGANLRLSHCTAIKHDTSTQDPERDKNLSANKTK
jgi:hypothetical protein